METKMRMYFLCVMFLIAILLQGCVVGLNQYGERVVFIDDKEKYNCKFLTVVTGTNGWGITEGAMNVVRNNAARVGGNAVKVIDLASGYASITVAAEALSCE